MEGRSRSRLFLEGKLGLRAVFCINSQFCSDSRSGCRNPMFGTPHRQQACLDAALQEWNRRANIVLQLDGVLYGASLQDSIFRRYLRSSSRNSSSSSSSSSSRGERGREAGRESDQAGGNHLYMGFPYTPLSAALILFSRWEAQSVEISGSGAWTSSSEAPNSRYFRSHNHHGTPFQHDSHTTAPVQSRRSPHQDLRSRSAPQ